MHLIRRSSVYALCIFGIIVSILANQSYQFIIKFSDETDNVIHSINKYKVDDFGRNYPTMLYPQVPNLLNYTHGETWYATSAYVDMRPLVYGDPPSITILVGGPVAEVLAGKTWYARLAALRTGAVLLDIKCEQTKFNPSDWRKNSTHASSLVICADEGKWQIFKTISQELGVCMIPNLESFCDVASIVPVGVPRGYPNNPFEWGKEHSENPYHSGKGSIALCVKGVRDDLNAETFRFFLEYYRRIGAAAAFVYMHSPGFRFIKVAENISSQQDHGSLTNMPRLVLLPWCMQLGATYLCKPGQARIPSPGRTELDGTLFGQLLAQQDCIFRAMGTYRWVAFIDLDEFILPRGPGLFTLHDIIDRTVGQNHGGAPAALGLRSAFYENCLPSDNDNTSVPLSQNITLNDLVANPRPAWAAARVSEIFPNKIRSKYVCDPFSCDRVGIHRPAGLFCDRYKGRPLPWKMSCAKEVAALDDAIIHHARVMSRAGSNKTPPCSELTGVQEVDWTFANFVTSISRSTPEATNKRFNL